MQITKDKTKNMTLFSNLHLLTYLGGIMILLGTYLIHEGNQRKTASKTKALTEKIDTLTNDNLRLSSKLTETTLQLNDKITGGNSFPSFRYMLKPYSKEELIVMIQVHGDNPLYDCSIGHYFVDNDLANGIKKTETKLLTKEESDKLFSNQNQAPVLTGGNFNPNGGLKAIGQGKIVPNQNEWNYVIRVWARNGTFSQFTKLIVDDGGRLKQSDSKVYNETGGNKVLIWDNGKEIEKPHNK